MTKNCTAVLVCDDSLLIRKQLTDFLTGLENTEVYQAQNGFEAVKLFEKVRPDMVFLDIVMPEMNGLECLKRIREIDDNAIVIMLSSVGTKENLHEALDLGATGFIQKPWKEDQLIDIVSKLKR
jgi:two-component system chemotaxis response regulator CheY